MLVEPMSPDVLVWLVNEWGSVPRAAAGEEERPYPDTGLLAALLAGSGVRACPPEVLAGPALSPAPDRLHRVFAAADLGERVALVAGLLTQTGVTPALELTDTGHRPGATWRAAATRRPPYPAGRCGPDPASPTRRARPQPHRRLLRPALRGRLHRCLARRPA